MQAEVSILPRDSLAEIMAADDVLAAKSKLQATTLQHRTTSMESGRSHSSHKHGEDHNPENP